MDYVRLLLFLGFSEACWYRLWWVLFVAVAYCSTRYLGWGGTIGSVFLVSLMLVFIDMHWIVKDMREHPEHYRSIGDFFWLGVICRAVLFNILLLPATITGLRLRASKRKPRAHM